MKEKDIFISTYDYIQPDNSMINNKKSLDASYINEKVGKILRNEL